MFKNIGYHRSGYPVLSGNMAFRVFMKVTQQRAILK
jgi:hypothetical protein